MTTQTIGLVGLGQIGMAAARKLLAAGHPVIGFRRSGCDELVAAGGQAAVSAAAVAGAADVVIQCLPGDAALEEAGFGTDGVLSAARPGLTVIELSTYPLPLKERYRDALAARGARLIEVEVSGLPQMVEAGTAALFVGATPDEFAQAEPILAAISGPVLHVGEFGAALAMKLVANHLVAVNTVAAAEAMALAGKLGLDLGLTASVIAKSAGGSVMFAQRAPRMASGQTLPAPGPVDTLAKYLKMIAAANAETGLTLPLFDLSKAIYAQAQAQGLGAHDIAVVHRLMTQGDQRG